MYDFITFICMYLEKVEKTDSELFCMIDTQNVELRLKR